MATPPMNMENQAASGNLAIQLSGIRKSFGETCAVDSISLRVEKGEFFSLLGPSGCGKTTLLRLIAGLDQPDAGSIRIAGTEMTETPAHKRPVNTVFQSYALFPHLNVHDNIAFGLKMRGGLGKTEIKQKVAAAMELVQITELEKRLPQQLSGGQKQRVALARAVVNEPEVLLLDEPLAAADAKLRQDLQRELAALQKRLALTFIYVTHDQDEALSLSDRLAVMSKGRIEQIGSPAAIYDQPRSRFVADFIGQANVLEGTVTNHALAAPFGNVNLPRTHAGLSRATVAIRPEKVVLGEEQQGENSYWGVVKERCFSGAETRLVIALNGYDLKATQLSSARISRVEVGARVLARLPPEAFVFLEES